MTTLTYPDGDYQFCVPEVLNHGDILRIHYTSTGNLTSTTEPVKFISKSLQADNIIVVETILEGKEHNITLSGLLPILRRIPPLPTKEGSFIFIDDLSVGASFLRGDTLAELCMSYGSLLWMFLSNDHETRYVKPEQITAWRPAYVKDTP